MSSNTSGSDVQMNKVLQDEVVKGTILKLLLGVHVSTSAYSENICHEKLINSDTYQSVTYLPNVKNLDESPPIMTIVQDKIDKSFMCKLVDYVGTKHLTTEPILLFFSMKSISEDIAHFFKTSKDLFLCTVDCSFWVKRCLVVTSESLNGFVDEKEMKKDLVALGHFIFNLDNDSEDYHPAIRYFFKVLFSDDL